MGFFNGLKEMAKSINEALTPKTIVDHVHERIKALDEEMQSGRRFVSIKKIWDWMKENERMRLCNYDRLNERLQEELEKIDKEKKTEDNYDVLGREFPSKEMWEEADRLADKAKVIEDATKTVKEACDCLSDRIKSKKNKEEKDIHYFGEAYLLNHYTKTPKVNDVVVVKNDDGIWIASTVQGVEGNAVWCEGDWNEEHLPYRFNEELVGTAKAPKDPSTLRWGDKVWVADDLKDDPELAIFIGFNQGGESDLRWLTLSSAKQCLKAFSDQNKWPPFGHWKYMWMAEDSAE